MHPAIKYNGSNHIKHLLCALKKLKANISEYRKKFIFRLNDFVYLNDFEKFVKIYLPPLKHLTHL